MVRYFLCLIGFHQIITEMDSCGYPRLISGPLSGRRCYHCDRMCK